VPRRRKKKRCAKSRNSSTVQKNSPTRVEESSRRRWLALKPVQDEIRARCQRVKNQPALFVGGSRAHHYQDLFRDIGMETVSRRIEFAHRRRLRGPRVAWLPTIKAGRRQPQHRGTARRTRSDRASERPHQDARKSNGGTRPPAVSQPSPPITTGMMAEMKKKHGF